MFLKNNVRQVRPLSVVLQIKNEVVSRLCLRPGGSQSLIGERARDGKLAAILRAVANNNS